MKKARIHISYSDRHFHPDQQNNYTFWYSCSQIAKHVWESLSQHYNNVTYGDTVPDESIDVLFTNRLISPTKSISRIIYFASVAHYLFLRNQLKKAFKTNGELPPEGLYSMAELWKYWRLIEYADHVLIIGNNKIRDTFNYHKKFNDHKLRLIQCGIDSSHFQVDFSKKVNPQFIYCVTRFSLRKGSHILASAWRLFNKKYPDANLIILGREGDYNLRDKLADLKNVKFKGEFQSGSKEYITELNNSKWVVFPSLAEGQAGTLLEAMSCGCVPIASRETGVDADIYGGYPLDPNSPEILAGMMEKAHQEWTREQSEDVVKRIKGKNSWPLFQENILLSTDNTLSMQSQPSPLKWLVFMDFALQIWRESLFK